MENFELKIFIDKKQKPHFKSKSHTMYIYKKKLK